MEIWKKLSRPPKDALKTIQAGRLKGKSDINPQWRYEIMTEVFGMCGVGWKFDIDSLWINEGSHEQKVQNARILLYIKEDSAWSDPIPGLGGSMLVVKEKAGLYTNDEAVKMAVTDALGTAMKMLGVASDIYRGVFDGSEYKAEKPKTYKNFKFLNVMKGYKKEFGDEEYYTILKGQGYTASNTIPPDKMKGVWEDFKAKLEILKTEGGR